LASPPLATIAPGSIQTVRLVVRKSPIGKETTYRIILDQIPPPVLPGTVQVALRLSIPVFVEPTTRTAAHIRFQVERDGAKAYLVAVNSGSAHETLRDIALTMQDGKDVAVGADTSPYLLADSSSRWPIVSPVLAPTPHGALHLTAQARDRVIDRQVPVVDVKP
jgi:fimbrial chaperone protein